MIRGHQALAMWCSFYIKYNNPEYTKKKTIMDRFHFFF